MTDDDPVARLYAAAKQNDIPMSLICQRAGVAPTTPSRWKNNRNGATTTLLSKLNAALAEMVEERLATTPAERRKVAA